MPSRGGLPGANRFTTAMQSEAQPVQNMQHFERGTSLACKPCPVIQIRPEGKLLVLPVTRTEQVPECWRSFPDWEGSADGDSPVATFGGPYWSVAPSPVLRFPNPFGTDLRLSEHGTGREQVMFSGRCPLGTP